MTSPKLTIYFTSDTHGYLYNTNFQDSAPRPMGLLGMRFPKDGNTLVIDGGDTIQGSPLTTFCRREHRPLPIAAALNARGYDYVTLGNHDFNNGAADLRAYLQELDAACLCANVTGADLPVVPSAVHTLENGLRVGLIGAVTHWVNRWEKPENLQGITVTEPLAPILAEAQRLRPLCDVLVGIYHGGFERDLATGKLLSDTDENMACRLCEAVGFDLLLTGHQHMAVAGTSWAGTHVVQTPMNATQYVQVTLEEDGWHSRLCPVPAEQTLTQTEAALRADLEAWLDRPIGHLSRAIWPEDRLKMAMDGSPIADLFNRVQLEASGADISCAALPNELRGFAAEVSVRDVVASYIYSNTLVVYAVTGRVLHEALEQCATYFDVGPDGSVTIAEPFLRPKEAHFNYDFFYGIDYRFDLRRPAGQRVARLSFHGQPVADDQTLTLVMCNYRATGAGGFDCYTACPRVKEIPTEVSELIIDFIFRHPTVEIDEPMPIVVK